MRKCSAIGHVDRFRSFGVVASVLLVPALLAGYARPAGAQEHVMRIEVTLTEFAFAPDPLRIPAGEEVVLVIKNDGVIPHEFMAGREATGDTFTHDLFADVEVAMSNMDPEAAEHGEAGGHDAAGGHAATPGHDEAGGHIEAGGHDAAGGHGDEGHGTMIVADAGQTMYMSFTLPESKRGEWSTGCFVVGHYEAGMHGVLIVE